jgi:hypothetical protein
MFRKLPDSKRLRRGLGPAVLLSAASRVIHNARSGHPGGGGSSSRRRTPRKDLDFGDEISTAVHGLKRWLRNNHASDRMKEVLDQWLAEDTHSSQQIIDVPVKPKKRGKSKSS